jgi:hypothetical protein
MQGGAEQRGYDDQENRGAVATPGRTSEAIVKEPSHDALPDIDNRVAIPLPRVVKSVLDLLASS